MSAASNRRSTRTRELPKRDESYLGKLQYQSRKEIVDGAMASLRDDLKKISSRREAAPSHG